LKTVNSTNVFSHKCRQKTNHTSMLAVFALSYERVLLTMLPA